MLNCPSGRTEDWRERENEGDGGENSGEVLRGGRRRKKGRRRDEDRGGGEDETEAKEGEERMQ